MSDTPLATRAETPLRLITHSEIDAFQKCRRYHHNRYGLGVRPEPSEALRIGTVIHMATDGIHKGHSLQAVLTSIADGYESAIANSMTTEQEIGLTVECEKCIRLVEGWYFRWSAFPVQVIASEQTFELPIVNPKTNQPSRVFRFAGKIDAIVRMEDDRLAVYELKTIGDDLSVGSDYWKTRQIDAQIARYLIAARAMGHPVSTILYDAIRKPEIRPKQIPMLDDQGFKIVLGSQGERIYLDSGKPRQSSDESKGFTLQSRVETPQEYSDRLAADIASRPEFYFARVEVPRLDHELYEAAADLWEIAKDMRQTELTGRHYLNTRACRGIGNCEYLDHCVNRTDLANVTPDGFIRVTNIHPELFSGENHASTSSAPGGEGSACSATIQTFDSSPKTGEPICAER